MANGDGPSFAGRRLAELRSAQRITAAELAERVPGNLVTKTVITNLESGRKRDMTLTEAVALAWALDVPVLFFLIGTDDAWGTVPFATSDEAFRGLTNIEYARRASMYPRTRDRWPPWWAEARLLENLVKAELIIVEMDMQEQFESDDDRESSILAHTATGDSVLVSRVDPPFVWERLHQPLVDHYRECLEAMELIERFQSRRGRSTPPDVLDRLDRVRKRVVELLAEDPDLDHGQNDRRGSSGPPPLNPATGRPRHSSGDGDGPPADSAE